MDGDHTGHLNTSRGSSGGKEDIEYPAKQTDEVDEIVKERGRNSVRVQMEPGGQVYHDDFKRQYGNKLRIKIHSLASDESPQKLELQTRSDSLRE